MKKFVYSSLLIHTVVLVAFALGGTTIEKCRLQSSKNIITFDFVQIGNTNQADNTIQTKSKIRYNSDFSATNMPEEHHIESAPQKKADIMQQNLIQKNHTQLQQPGKDQNTVKIPAKDQDIKPKPTRQTDNQKKPVTSAKANTVKPQQKRDAKVGMQTKPNAKSTQPNEVDRFVHNLAAGIGTNADKVGVLTATQQDVIKQRLSRCWNIPIGIKNIQNIKIDVRLELNDDGSVHKITILRTANCDRNDIEIVQNSIYRALNSREFSPLPFDRATYASWKVIDLCFYPGDML